MPGASAAAWRLLTPILPLFLRDLLPSAWPQRVDQEAAWKRPRRLHLPDDPRDQEDLVGDRACGPRRELNLGDADQKLLRLTGPQQLPVISYVLHLQQQPPKAGKSSVAATTLVAKATACHQRATDARPGPQEPLTTRCE